MSSKLLAKVSSDEVPRLEVQQAMLSMKYWNNNKEWTLEEKFDHIAEAGFTGIFGALPESGEQKLWRNLLERSSFTSGLESFPVSGEQLTSLLEQSSDYPALYINAQVPDVFCVGDNITFR
ncbi:hypothetical protein ACFQ88_24165 [Paenibacillus sp. NPDC056579]|uniref:hypothetical protein n=1 Tax=Paenibacillus sp. NPDC056579 TaxID=3345871 RepID=UPI0036974C71